MGTSSKELARKLNRLASRQHGCFTAAQAIDIGYADSVHLYHVKTGSWSRIYRGVYRLAHFPETPAARCQAALLWTRDKNGIIQGCLHHDTFRALQNNNLSPDSPIQLVVHKKFRRSSSIPDGILLSFLPSKELQSSMIDGFPVQLDPGSPSPIPPLPPHDLDLPDYYDWIDYQSARWTPVS